MSTEKTVAVAGATGRLGAIVDELLVRGHRVLAITRDPESDAARRLRVSGAEVRYGDFDDSQTIIRAARGADALFATGTAHRVGPDGELRHGIAVADAAAAAGVGQLVYSSGDGAAADSPLPLMRAKFAVERHIGSLPIGHTLLAPVYFMENLFNPWNLAALRSGLLPSPIPVDAPLQQVAIADLVSLAALAIERPGDYSGKRIRVASEELSAADAAVAISTAIGVELEPRQVQPDQLPLGLRALFGWLAATGHDVDLAELHSRHPEVGWHGYTDWVDSQRQRFRGLCPHRAEVVH